MPKLFIIFLFFSMPYLSGQNELFEIEYLNVEDGLSNRFCRQIIEDNSGNIWIATSDGLNRYDGFEFKVFASHNSPILKDFIYNLIVDANGNIWVIQVINVQMNHTNIYGFKDHEYYVSVVNPVDLSVISLDEYFGDDQSIKTKNITEIIKGHNEIFIRTDNNFIYSFAKNLKYETRWLDSERMLGRAGLTSFYSFKNELISVVDNNGSKLDSFKVPSLKHHCYFYPLDEKRMILTRKVKNVASSVIITTEGLKNDSFLDSIDVKCKFEYPYPIEADHKQGFNNHIRIFNSVFINCNPTPINDILEEDILIYSSHYSESGVLYIGTINGLIAVSVSSLKFRTLFNKKYKSYGFRGILKNDSLLLANNYRKEIFIHNESEPSHRLQKALTRNGISYYQDPLNPSLIWTCYHSNKIRKIDLANDTFKWYEGIGFKERGVGFRATTAIIRSQYSNKLYFGGNGDLMHLNEEIDSIENLNLESILNGKITINHVVEKDSILWFACAEGILKYNEFENSLVLMNSANSQLQYDIINFLHFDDIDPNILWIATKGSGLHKWNLSSSEYKVYNESNGLSNNDVHCIYQDSDLNLWLPTNRYLNQLNINDEYCIVYTPSDGTTDVEFNLFSHCRDDEGYLYFGGLNGVTYFHPDSITNSIPVNINIRCIGVSFTDNKGHIEESSCEDLHNGVLNIEQSQLSVNLSFSTNRLFRSSELSFQYKIENLDNSWINMNSNHLRLSNLPFGNHQLSIRLKPTHSTLKSDVFRLRLNVIKPFNETITFYMLLLLSSICLVSGIAWYRYRIIKNINLQLENKIQERTLALQRSNQTKDKLFALIAHDLKNPIASLNNFLDKITYLVKKDRIDDIVELSEQIEKKIHTLDQNLNNILRWALIEQGKIPYNPTAIRVKHVIVEICSLYYEAIEEKNLTLDIQIDPKLNIFVDETAFQSIFRNLLHNAIKFSSNHSTIKIWHSKQSVDRECLNIQNEGKPFDKKNNHVRSLGLGLKIVDELVLQNKGTFIIKGSGPTTTLAKVCFPKREV